MTLRILSLAVFVALPVLAQSASLRVIGNAGIELSDGSQVILIDFPYQSGAYGYAEFDSSEIFPRPDALCVFTHRHADHFDADNTAAVGCKAIGPKEVVQQLAAEQRLPGESPWTFGSASIACVDAAHSNVQHCAYLIQWQGKTIFVSGDTEDLAPLMDKMGQPDLVVLSHWLADAVPQVMERFPDARIVYDHLEDGRTVELCTACLAPAQGQTINW